MAGYSSPSGHAQVLIRRITFQKIVRLKKWSNRQHLFISALPVRVLIL